MFSPLHREIATYYRTPTMYKVSNTGAYSAYVCPIANMINAHRYLIAMVPLDAHPEGTATVLAQLPWVVFQTRSFQKCAYPFLRAPKHAYEPSRQFQLLNQVMERERVDDGMRYIVYRTSTLAAQSVRATAFLDESEAVPFHTKTTLLALLESFKTMVEII